MSGFLQSCWEFRPARRWCGWSWRCWPSCCRSTLWQSIPTSRPSTCWLSLATNMLCEFNIFQCLCLYFGRPFVLFFLVTNLHLNNVIYFLNFIFIYVSVDVLPHLQHCVFLSSLCLFRMIIGVVAGLMFGRPAYYLSLLWCCVAIFVFMVSSSIY